MKPTIIFLCVTALMFTGCELYEQDEYREYYVVESYLVANDAFPEVRLSSTSKITEEYTFSKNAISGADVKIHLLKADSSISESYSYREITPGIYVTDGSAIVQESQLYQLFITTPNGDEITSTTYVPGDFETVNKLQDSYVYQSNQQVKITTTPSTYITNRQTYYLFTINAVNPDLSNLTPFYLDLVVEQDENISDYYINSSGIINEGNYERNEDDRIDLKVPWLAVAFYDTNEVVVNAIDDNMYNFLRSQDVQTGGTALSPGEIQNIRYHVNGGIGIFGSMATDTNRVVITRP